MDLKKVQVCFLYLMLLIILPSSYFIKIIYILDFISGFYYLLHKQN